MLQRGDRCVLQHLHLVLLPEPAGERRSEKGCRQTGGSPRLEHERRAERDEHEPDRVVPPELVLQVAVPGVMKTFEAMRRATVCMPVE